MDLLTGAYVMTLYLCFTPLVLLNFIRPIAESKYLRMLVLLTPGIPVLLGLVMYFRLLLDYGARMNLYLSVTALVTTVIIIWNAKIVSHGLKN